MRKKILSSALLIFILTFAFLFSSLSVAAGEAYSEADSNTPPLYELPEVSKDCNRFFFIMPDEWYNDCSDSAGIYWWEGKDAPGMWPGYKAYKADAENVYYYDVPKDVTTIIWNNFVDGGYDLQAEIYYKLRQTLETKVDNYEESDWGYGSYCFYPEGVESLNGMVFVVDTVNTIYSEATDIPRPQCGEWFYYYGNGEYGVTPCKNDSRVFSDDAQDLIALFEQSVFVIGDADDDAIVNITDVTCVQKHIAKVDTDIFTKSADANSDGKLDIKDATLIQKHTASFDIDESIGESMPLFKQLGN